GGPAPRGSPLQLGECRHAHPRGVRSGQGRLRAVGGGLSLVSASILSSVRGFVFDLDGCVWNGSTLNPGARETLAALDRAGRGLAFVSNNSRATGGELRERLHGLGVDVARHVLTPLVDPRMPIEGGDFLPGSGATVAAIATAAGVRPIVVGKPEPPLFRMALERMALSPAAAAMVGDSVPSDIRGARAVGMVTVLYAPEEGTPAGEADLVVGSFAELARLAGVG